MKTNNLLRYLLVAAVAVFFYGTSLKYGFSQDDFFHLSIAKANSVTEFAKFFLPNVSDWVFYRPISTQTFYYLFSSVFGWRSSPLPMHLFMLLLHIFNSIMVVKIVSLLTKKSHRASLLAGIIYASSPIHFLSLYYIGAVQQLLTTFFSLLTILAFANKKKTLELISLTLAFLSKEIAIRVPVIVTIFALLRGDSLKSAISKTKHLYLLTFLYMLFRYLVGLDIPAQYSFSLNPLKLAASSMWYGLFSLGAPEELLRYGLSGGKINLTQFIVDHSFTAVLLSISIALLLIIIFFTLYKNFRVAKTRARSLLYLLWWIIAIAPILPFSTHKYPHYLDLSLIAILALLFSSIKKKSYLTSLAALFLVSSFLGLSIEKTTHWTIGRAEIVNNVYALFENNSLCEYDSLLITGDDDLPKELSYALMLEHGPQLICNNQELQIYYSGVNYTNQAIDKTIYITEELL